MSDTTKNYERMQQRLRAFNVTLRRSLDGSMFYATNRQQQTYIIRWSEATQIWICNAVGGMSGGSEDEAKRILRIALGEITAP